MSTNFKKMKKEGIKEDFETIENEILMNNFSFGSSIPK